MPQATIEVYGSSLNLFQNQSLRMQLDLLNPQVAARVQSNQAHQKAYHDVRSHTRQFSVGQSVMIHNIQGGTHWACGIIVKISGPLYITCNSSARQADMEFEVSFGEAPSMQSSDPEI